MIDYEKLIDNNSCPYCGWNNPVEYGRTHVIIYICSMCGFSLSFIDPRDGFKEWEIGEFKDDDDAGFMDAMEKAEKEAIEDSNVEYKTPDKNCIDGSKVMVQVSKINDWFFDFIDEIKECSEEPWKNGILSTKKFILRKLFEN